MSYKDIRIHSFELSPEKTDNLYKTRYNGESTIRLGFDIKGFDSYVVFNTELSKLISSIYQIDKKLAILSANIPEEAIKQFTTTSMIEEIQQSNEVENVNSTHKDIKDALDAVNRGNYKKRFASMVRKYMYFQRNTEIPLSACQHIRDLYDEFISDEVYRENPNDQLDGEIFRNSVVWINNQHGESIHEGLIPESKIITAMDAALSILNNDNYDVLIRVALFHYFFGYIHPFYNGNGRMSRFISSYMLSKDFSTSACLRISYVIKQHRKKYYELFQNANDKRNRGELTGFVMGYLSFFKEAIEETYESLSEKNRLYLQNKQMLTNWLTMNMSKCTTAQEVCFIYMLQEDMFGESSMDISKVALLMECSERTARKVLAEAGSLISVTKAGRKQIWHINLKALYLEGTKNMLEENTTNTII